MKRRETLSPLKYPHPRQLAHCVKDEESARQLIEVLGGAKPTCGFKKHNKPVPDITNYIATSLHTQEIMYNMKHFF